MIIDRMLDFGQCALKSPGACANVVDTKVPGEALGTELYLVIKTGAGAPAGGQSLVCKLQTSDTEDFSAATDLVTTPSVALANMAANTILFRGRVPMGAKRYLRVYADATGTFTSGSVEAFLVQGPQAGWGEV